MLVFAADKFAGQKLAVFGLARSGLALIDALVAGGAQVFAWDDNESAVAKARQHGVPVSDLRDLAFAELDGLVLSPGVPLTHPKPHWTVDKAQAAGIEIIGDTEVFMRQIAGSGARTLCITGTNGKSTTTALAGHILREAGLDAHIGGNIGKAVFLLPPPGVGTVYVLELSSYQIDLMPQLRPDVGVLMNLTADHLDRHGTMAHYAEVKARMFDRQGEADTAVISLDDAWCREIAAGVKRAKVVGISVDRDLPDGVSAPQGILHDRCDGKGNTAIDLTGILSLRGRHNWQNACAAYAAARALGVDGGRIAAVLASFPGLAHRMELVGRRGNVIFINDSKATNADAAGHALAAFRRIYWIAGGRPKFGGIEQLAPYFDRVAKAYLIGEAAGEFAKTLAGTVPVEMCGTLDKAVQSAASDASADAAGEVAVLLSPACASFDQFADFEIRGDAFRSTVNALDGVIAKTGEAA